MTNFKVTTILGTRPEIIRLSEVIKELDRTTNHVLVHTGQNYDYELNEIFFDNLELRKPDYFLKASDTTSAKSVGSIINKVDDVLEQEKPDALLILGDTNSGMAAYAAKRRKIPVFHMEAGNRCFDMRVPEEINRKVLDHMCDINLVYSDIARLNLLREGLPSDRILKTGSPLFEVIKAHEKKIENSSVLDDLNLIPNEYFVLSSHREENIELEGNFDKLIQVINHVVTSFKKPVLFSAHPRTRKKIEERGVNLPPEVTISKPLGFFDYIHLQKNAACVITDSGTISEESSILNFPAVNLRESHERLEAMDEASVIMTGLNPDRVIQAIKMTMQQQDSGERMFKIPADYTNDNVSKKVARIILSYTDYVRRVI